MINDLHDLGYESIELEDMIDLLEEDDAWIEYMPHIIYLSPDEYNFINPKVLTFFNSLSAVERTPTQTNNPST
jgi:hypothetical protein